jgi:hypothetical protein
MSSQKKIKTGSSSSSKPVPKYQQWRANLHQILYDVITPFPKELVGLTVEYVPVPMILSPRQNLATLRIDTERKNVICTDDGRYVLSLFYVDSDGEEELSLFRVTGEKLWSTFTQKHPTVVYVAEDSGLVYVGFSASFHVYKLSDGSQMDWLHGSPMDNSSSSHLFEDKDQSADYFTCLVDFVTKKQYFCDVFERGRSVLVNQRYMVLMRDVELVVSHTVTDLPLSEDRFSIMTEPADSGGTDLALRDDLLLIRDYKDTHTDTGEWRVFWCRLSMYDLSSRTRLWEDVMTSWHSSPNSFFFLSSDVFVTRLGSSGRIECRSASTGKILCTSTEWHGLSEKSCPLDFSSNGLSSTIVSRMFDMDLIQ